MYMFQYFFFLSPGCLKNCKKCSPKRASCDECDRGFVRVPVIIGYACWKRCPPKHKEDKGICVKEKKSAGEQWAVFREFNMFHLPVACIFFFVYLFVFGLFVFGLFCFFFLSLRVFGKMKGYTLVV